MSPAHAPVDTTISVITPENIAFDYQLAGPFRRLPAYLIDVVARWTVILVVGLMLLLFTAVLSINNLGSLAIAAMLILYFVISWFYGTLCEAYFNGRTFGKWMCGIRTIGVAGEPITGTQALLRNLLRLADLLPMAAIPSGDETIAPIYAIPTGMIGLLCCVGTRRMQRLGDLAAGTMVVVDERQFQPIAGKNDDPRVAPVSTFLPADYHVSSSMARTLAVYAERRHYLTPARRNEIVRHLAGPLIDRFGFREDFDPDLLMMALFHRTFLAQDGEEIDFGPLQGHSPMRLES